MRNAHCWGNTHPLTAADCTEFKLINLNTYSFRGRQLFKVRHTLKHTHYCLTKEVVTETHTGAVPQACGSPVWHPQQHMMSRVTATTSFTATTRRQTCHIHSHFVLMMHHRVIKVDYYDYLINRIVIITKLLFKPKTNVGKDMAE